MKSEEDTCLGKHFDKGRSNELRAGLGNTFLFLVGNVRFYIVVCKYDFSF